MPLPPIDVPGISWRAAACTISRRSRGCGRASPPEQARADLAALPTTRRGGFPKATAAAASRVQPLHEKIVGDVREALSCCWRGRRRAADRLRERRQPAAGARVRASAEIAIRAALGAGRGRLIRQLITESLLLGAAGAAAGLLAGGWAIALLLKVMPDGIPRVAQIGLDVPASAALAILVSFASALTLRSRARAAGLAHRCVARAARSRSPARPAGRGAREERAVLVVCEIALTLVLLVSAGCSRNSFVRLQSVDPGFRVEQVTLVPCRCPSRSTRTASDRRRSISASSRGSSSGPRSVGGDPLSEPDRGANANGTFTIEGQPISTRADRPFTAIASVSPHYFRTLGIPIIQGRTFSEQDREPAPAVAIVNATFARNTSAGQSPLASACVSATPGTTGSPSSASGATRATSGCANADAAALPAVSPLSAGVHEHRGAKRRGHRAVASLATDRDHKCRSRSAGRQDHALREVLQESVAEPRFRTLLLGHSR